MPTSVYIPHLTADIDGLDAALAAKQATLVSGTTIKTVNGQSLLGPGDLTVAGGSGDATSFSVQGTINANLSSLPTPKQKILYKSPGVSRLQTITVELGTVPVGQAVILKAWTRISGSPSEITVGGALSVAPGASPATAAKTGLNTLLAAGDLMWVEVFQTGTTTPGADLTVTFEGTLI